MPKNMGMIDRIVRIIIALLIVVLYFAKQISGVAAIILGIIALAFVVTSFLGFCPTYLPFGISTKKKA